MKIAILMIFVVFCFALINNVGARRPRYDRDDGKDGHFRGPSRDHRRRGVRGNYRDGHRDDFDNDTRNGRRYDFKNGPQREFRDGPNNGHRAGLNDYPGGGHRSHRRMGPAGSVYYDQDGSQSFEDEYPESNENYIYENEEQNDSGEGCPSKDDVVYLNIQ
ncbi:hypothetical protein RUM43_004001 [Polyplax serrata]|uniref:Uncharacterized protein n=1 Tax=Polyplax serrata TaxID=468196 RepID=A0AAN8SAJ2_POLSC